MSQNAIPTPVDCCTPCVPNLSTTPGAAGIDAYAIATGGEEMPAVGATVEIATTSPTTWIAAGEPLFVEGWGILLVDSVGVGAITLLNPGYVDNEAPATILAAGAIITPSGFPGDGVNAYTTAENLFPAAQPLMPADDGASTVQVTTTTTTVWMGVGQILYVENWGYMQVVTVDSDTTVTLLNLADSSAGTYATNAAPTTPLTAGSLISPGGLQGLTGETDAALFLLKAQDLADLNSPPSARTNLGLGTAAVLNSGVGNANLAFNDGALTAGQAIFATATGIGTQSAATARTSLGLGTIATQAASAVAITGGSITGITDLAVADGGTGASTAAAARTNLGVIEDAMLLYRQEESNGVDGGTFTSGSWQTVPINTERVDTGGYGSITGNTITLAAGTYRYTYMITGYRVNAFQGRLYNVSDGAVVANSYGSVGSSTNGTGVNAEAWGAGRFTIASARDIRVEAQCTTTQGTSGFGLAAGFMVGEIYSFIELIKE